MKTTIKTTMITGAIAIALAAPAYAELEGELSLSYQNEYSYRGQQKILSQGAAGANTDDAITTELNLSYSINDQWSLVAGASIATIDYAGADHNRYRAGIRYTADCYTLELGYQDHNDFSANGVTGDTGEIYLNIGTECPLTGGNLNLFVAHDTDLLEGTYVELSLNKGWDLSETVKLDVTVGVSASFDYWDNVYGTGDDWNSAYITVGFPIKATDNLTLTPYVSYSEGFGALDPSGVRDEGDDVSFGVKASVKF
jgi:hypothetical protein